MNTIMKKNALWNLFLTGLAPTVCSVLVLLLVFSFIVRNSTKTVDQANEQNMLYLVSDRLDDLIMEEEQISSKISGSEWFYDSFVTSCLSSKRLNAATKTEITAALSRMVAERTGVARIAYSYFLNPEVLFTSTGVFENLGFYTDRYPDKFDYSFFDSNITGITSVSVSGQNYLLYSKDITNIAGGSNKARLNVFVESDYVLDLLNMAAGRQAQEFNIVTLDGTVLWTGSSGLYNDEKCVKISCKSDVLPVIYEISVPQSVHRKATRQALPILISVLIIDMIICTFLACYYAIRNYRPFKETTDTLDLVQPIARQRMLRTVLDGTGFIEDENKSAYSVCGINFRYQLFNVVAIDTGNEENEIDKAAARMEQFIAESSEGIKTDAYLYLHDSSRFSVIVNFGSEDDLRVFYKRLYRKCSENEETELTVVGIGNSVNNAKFLHRSSDQAEFALTCFQSGRQKGISHYEDAAKKTKILINLSRSEERMLEHAVAEGNEAAAGKIVSDILNENKELKTKYSLRLLGDAILFIVTRSAQEAGIRVLIPNEMDKIADQMRLKEAMLGAIKNVCRDIQEKSNEGSSGNGERILNYVNEHLCDKNMSVKMIADLFGMPQASVSEAFKKLTGRKYIDYVNEKRIQKAVELIYNENLDIKRVYENVGYGSIETFRRNYQKYSERIVGEREKMFGNYHTHTYRCRHASEDNDEAYVKAAIQAGFKELGFADHCPWPYSENFYKPGVRMHISEFSEYLQSLSELRECYKDRIKIYIGLECEFFKEYLDTLREFRQKCDYLLLGVHWRKSEEAAEMSSSECVRPEELELFAENTIEGMESGLFLYVNHPDHLFSSYPVFDKCCRELSHEIARKAKQLDIPLEYNLYGLKKRDQGSFKGLGYPCNDFWRVVAEEGCRVVIGCDAHNPEMLLVPERIKEAEAFLMSIGINVEDRIEIREVDKNQNII